MSVSEKTEVASPRRRGRIRKRLLRGDWPDADRRLWDHAFVAGDIFDEAGAGAHLASTTRFGLECAYGRWLSHLAKKDPSALALAPFDRVERDAIRRFAEELATTNTGRSVAIQLRQLRQALRILGINDELRWMAAIASRLEHACAPRAKQHRVKTSDELTRLGRLLMRQADEKQLTEQPIRAATAQLYRDGLLISILAATAIRRRSFASLTLHSNVIRTGQEWRIILRSAETKQKRDHEVPLGVSTSKYVDRFLEVFRPAFFRSDKHRALWPSRKGVPMTGNAIYDAICRRTKAYFGHSVNPHLFRDGAATFCALNAPESLGSASALLGHAGPKSLKHYNQAGSIIAGRRLAKILEERLVRRR